MLAWKMHRALIKAHLEPYLGFLHSTQHGKPSLVCDVQELYRHLIDDFLLQHYQDLRKKDFIVKTEPLSRAKHGKRVYLNDKQTNDLMRKISDYLEQYIEVSRKQIGKRQKLETLINEDVSLFAIFLRGESKRWFPRKL